MKEAFSSVGSGILPVTTQLPYPWYCITPEVVISKRVTPLCFPSPTKYSHALWHFGAYDSKFGSECNRRIWYRDNSNKDSHESVQIYWDDYFLSVLHNRIAHIANTSTSNKICELVM